MGSPERPVLKDGNKNSQKESKDAQERITCPGSCPCSTRKSTCTCTCTCTCVCTCSSCTPSCPSSRPPACPCSCSSPCSSGTCSPCSAKHDAADGSHSWWSCCRLCCRPGCWQRHQWDVLWRFLSTCTCTCSCPCTSCPCSSTKRANWTLRLGDQTVPAVQPDPVRHHQLRGLQRGAERMQAEEPYDSLDSRSDQDFGPNIDFCLQLPPERPHKLCGPINRAFLVCPCDSRFYSEASFVLSLYIRK